MYVCWHILQPSDAHESPVMFLKRKRKTLMVTGKSRVPSHCGGSWLWSRGQVTAGQGWRLSQGACDNGQTSLNLMGSLDCPL